MFVPHHSSPQVENSTSAIPYLLSKKLNPCEAAAAAAAGAGRDLVRFSIFRIEEVSGRGPVSFRGELPAARPPPPGCLLDTLLVELVVVAETVCDPDVEDEGGLETLLLCLKKEGFGICLTEALAGDFVTDILLEAGRLVIDTVLVFDEPSLDEPSLDEPKVVLVVLVVGVVLEVVEAEVLGNFVIVTSGVGGEMVGAFGVVGGRQVFVGDFELVVLVTVVEDEETCSLPLVSGVWGAALLVGDRSMGTGSVGLGRFFTMAARFNSRIQAAV